MRMSGKRALLELFKQEGVKYVFGNPGTTELPLMDAFATEHELEYVLCLQESAGMAMADGYSQASGELSVVNVHVTPGLGNAMGMLFNAQKSHAPVIVVAGQQDQSFALSEPILWADLVGMAAPFVKWAVEVRRIEDLPAIVHRAAKVALTAPTGPVFISMPGDIMNAEAELDLGRPTRIAPASPDAAAIEHAAALVLAARNPIILAGDGVAQGRAQAQLVRLAELTGAPVYSEGIPNTSPMPFQHPQFAGNNPRTAPVVRELLDRHDLILSAGADLYTLSFPSKTSAVPPGMPIVHIDSDPWEIGKNHAAAAALAGDIGAILAALANRLEAAASADDRERFAGRRQATTAAVAGLRKEMNARADALEAARPLQPLPVMREICRALPEDVVVIEEALSSAAGLRQFLRLRDERSFYALRAGGIGWGLPAAVGIKLAQPGRPVVALVGDGSAIYNIQALWTAAHLGLEIVFVLLNNASYRILKQRMNALMDLSARHNRFVGMDIVDPPLDLLSLGRGFGVAGEKVTELADVGPAVARGFGRGSPHIVEIALDGAFQ